MIGFATDSKVARFVEQIQYVVGTELLSLYPMLIQGGETITFND